MNNQAFSLCGEVIMEYLVKISSKARILEIKQRHLKITVLTSYMNSIQITSISIYISRKKVNHGRDVNKFIDEGKQEHEEMSAFIREFRTTNELLFKERNNSLSELRTFGVPIHDEAGNAPKECPCLNMTSKSPRAKIVHHHRGTDTIDPFSLQIEKRKGRSPAAKVLEKHRGAFAWKMLDIKGISPSLCTHKILMEDDFKPVIQPQRRLNPKVQDVVKNEIVKLLDSGLIYPISHSSWVSPIYVVPKKGGMTIDNELIPSCTVTGWRVCIDYRKLNDATQKDHFPLPFIDQMLEHLSGNEYYCLLDGFLGFFQIPIALEDQEKTTFTCPYGTFAYRRILFWLCNAPATFQRCMTAIFHDMVEDFMEVYMDDFSVFDNSFNFCLANLDKMLARCEETNLVLNVSLCRKLFKTLSLDESRLPEYNLFFDLEENSEEEFTEIMVETMDQYMSKTRANYGLGIAGPKIDMTKITLNKKANFLRNYETTPFAVRTMKMRTDTLRKF
ncbi:putative reverse transcriptase domain-containing protein [Tanacetum coccineum]